MATSMLPIDYNCRKSIALIELKANSTNIMPRKNKYFTDVPRMRENPRLIRAHESMIDLITRRERENASYDVLSSVFFDYNMLRAMDIGFQNDLIYSDSDDEGSFDYQCAAQKPLLSHPQIRTLTQEEADNVIKNHEEQQKRNDRARKNKQKKLRKKERKRLVKENTAQKELSCNENIFVEEGQTKSDSSEDESVNILENKLDEEDPTDVEPSTTENETSTRDDGKHSDSLQVKEELVTKPKNLHKHNSVASMEKCEQTVTTKKKKIKKNLIHQPVQEKLYMGNPDVQQREEIQNNIEKNKMEACIEDFIKRSTDLACIGHRMADNGLYEAAVQYFTDAIKYNPTQFKLFGNRSLCFERMQEYDKALADAELALSIEPNWIKGLFRKGKALCGLKRYHEASLVYKTVLRMEPSSKEAVLELKRAQTLHLMEMGFTWTQSCQALKAHATLEEAVESLFSGRDYLDDSHLAAEEDETHSDDGEWMVSAASRSRSHIKRAAAGETDTPKTQSPTPTFKSSGKLELFPIWVGSLSPTVSHKTLRDLFSRFGTVHRVKLLLSQQCAFVHYTRKEDCEKAILLTNGMVVEGVPLAVRYPNKIHPEIGISQAAATDPIAGPASGNLKGECFFWRTTGCTKEEKCVYVHIPEHKHIDRLTQ